MDLQVALVEPEIPPNTGTIARLCLATNSALHLVGRLGFQLDDRRLRRAGLDYWRDVRVSRHESWEAMRALDPSRPAFFFSARATRMYSEAAYPDNSLLVFGSETRGLPPSLLKADDCYRIPILNPKVRSLNLATAVAIVLFEAIRQNMVSVVNCGVSDEN